MAAVVTPHRITTGPGRADLRLVLPNERSQHAEPLFSVPAVLAAILLVLVLMVGALAVGRGAFAGLAPSTATSATPSPVAVADAGSMVVVHPGDTMWSIARDLQPSGDIRPLVDRLVASHGTTTIAPGDRISIDG